MSKRYPKKVKKHCGVEICNYGASFSFVANVGQFYCKRHALKGMVKHENLVSIYQCKEEGCTTKPAYNYETEKKPLYCASHAKEGMSDTRKGNCVLKDCNRRLGNRSLIYCLSHQISARKKLIENGNFY